MIFIHCLLKTNSCNKIFATHIDSCNPRHDYPLWRRTQATSASYTAEQVPRETQLQQREERENTPPEEENDEMLYAHGNGRTTGKNVCVLEFLAAFYLTLLYFFHMSVLYF